jgi:glycosidase
LNRVAPVIFEVNTRCCLNELSSKLGRRATLADIPESCLEQWQSLGFTHVWFMGVWQSGPLAREAALAQAGLIQTARELLDDFKPGDVQASPYAIASYEVDPAYGGGEALRVLRNRLAAAGLKLILDFVPNHVGLDDPWIAQHPEYFFSVAEGTEGAFRANTDQGPRWLMHGRDPYFPPWVDTAQLNYGVLEVQQAVIHRLLKVANECDGVRCDMAMLLLRENFVKTWTALCTSESMPETEFWSRAICAVKETVPNLLLIAEAYWGSEPELQKLGFNYTYDKTVYDFLVARDSPGLEGYLKAKGRSYLEHSLHFLENHDEPRAWKIFSDAAEHRKVAERLFLLPGAKLVHQGQMEGARHRAPVQLARRPQEPFNELSWKMYKEILFRRKQGAAWPFG